MKEFALKVTVILSILLAGVILWQLRSIVVLILVSLAITATLRVPIVYLIHRGVRRSLALLLVYGLGLGGIIALLALLSYPLTDEVNQLGETVVKAYTRLQQTSYVAGTLAALLADQLPTVEQLAVLLTGDQIQIVGQTLFDVTGNVGSVIGQFILALVLSIYWTADQLRFERFWLSLFPANQRRDARELWHMLEAQIGAYLRSELVQSVLAGVLLVTGFWLMGIDYPMIWALLIALGWLVPLVGGLIFLGPLWIVVWVNGGPWLATAAVGYTIVVLAFMEFFIEQRLYSQTRYNHVLVIMIMLLLVSAYGILGLVLAPVLTIAIEILLAKIFESAPRSQPQPQPQAIPHTEVVTLQARLEELRPVGLNLNTPSVLRLTTFADRLESLLKATEKL